MCWLLYILDLHFVLFLLTVHNKRICYAVLWGLVLYLCCISYTNWKWLPVLSRKLAITGSYFCTRCHLSTFVAKIKTLLSGVNVLIKHFANDVTERLNINKVVKSINFSFLAVPTLAISPDKPTIEWIFTVKFICCPTTTCANPDYSAFSRQP